MRVAEKQGTHKPGFKSRLVDMRFILSVIVAVRGDQQTWVRTQSCGVEINSVGVAEKPKVHEAGFKPKHFEIKID